MYEQDCGEYMPMDMIPALRKWHRDIQRCRSTKATARKNMRDFTF